MSFHNSKRILGVFKSNTVNFLILPYWVRKYTDNIISVLETPLLIFKRAFLI